jgi:hypothetical protein
MLIVLLIGASLRHERPDTDVPELIGADALPYKPWKPRRFTGVA